MAAGCWIEDRDAGRGEVEEGSHMLRCSRNPRCCATLLAKPLFYEANVRRLTQWGQVSKKKKKKKKNSLGVEFTSVIFGSSFS